MTKLYDAMVLIAKEPEFAEDGRRNLDIVREALDLVEKIWRLVSIEPEFADLFYAYGVLDSGRFIGESSHLVGLGSNQASFYLRA